MFGTQTCDVSPKLSIFGLNEVDANVEKQLRKNLFILIRYRLQIKMRYRCDQNQRNPNPYCQKRNDADVQNKNLERVAPLNSGLDVSI